MKKQAFYTAKVPAKLNLSLAITGRKEGMHALDMIMYPYEKLADTATFYPQEGNGEIYVKCDFADFEEDRFVNAIRDKVFAIFKQFCVCGKVVIEKNIPLGAGLGGSSASIVALIKAVENYCHDIGKNTSLDTRFLLSLGSDVPYMYKGGICRVQGVGEIVEELEYDKKLDFDVIIARGGADSGACYKQYDKLHEIIPSTNPPSCVGDAIEEARNDLLEASCIVNPEIKVAIDTLKSRGYRRVYMSGSGSAVFAITDCR